ncbi:DUF4013 domain-containing protein [Candidatus Woesearchaeota archaeon]|nr:DUF4013 domain-containing protein [Candidatus Woesearchaeota archaeon]
MVKFGAAIARPFTDVTKLAIGTVLGAIPVVNFLGTFFVAGYGLKSAETAMKGDYKLPEWNEWGRLFIRGLTAVVISLIYFLPVILLFILVAGSLILAMFSQMPPALQTPTPTGFATAITGMAAAEAPETAIINPAKATPEDLMRLMGTMLIALGGAVLIVLPLLIIISYLLPAAIIGYATENRFGAAFSFPTIFKKTFRAKWLVAWLLNGTWWALIFVTLLAFRIAFTFIPFIGPVLDMILKGAMLYIMAVTTYTLFGEAYND